jgi:hypothetical protein
VNRSAIAAFKRKKSAGPARQTVRGTGDAGAYAPLTNNKGLEQMTQSAAVREEQKGRKWKLDYGVFAAVIVGALMAVAAMPWIAEILLSRTA